MNLEQYQYTVAGFRAFELYPFTKMTKRYFRGFRQNQPDQLYRIIIYPHELVKVEPLIETLKTLKGITNDLLGKIISIYEETSLVKTGEKPEIETVIAVILGDQSQGSYISIFDFLVQMGNVSEIFSRDCAFKLLTFIKQMKLLGFTSCFNSNDLLIQKTTGEIKFDNYGDDRHFIIKQEIISDIWELGSLIFTLLKGGPPYNRKVQSDPHYLTLHKGQFQKFWGMYPQKPVKHPSQNATKFIEACFSKQCTIQKLESMPWFQNFSPIPKQQIMQQISNMIATKIQKKALRANQQRIRTEKINQALRQRACLVQKRQANSQFIQTFLQYLLQQQDKERPLSKCTQKQQMSQKQKTKIASLLTTLNLNENKNVKIYDIRDKKSAITFKIKTQLDDYTPIDCEVQLQIQKFNESISFVCKRIQASLYESMWINNYIRQLCAQI